MKVVFVDEACGLGGNNITPEQWTAFNAVQKGKDFANPMLVHWEYGKAGAFKMYATNHSSW